MLLFHYSGPFKSLALYFATVDIVISCKIKKRSQILNLLQLYFCQCLCYKICSVVSLLYLVKCSGKCFVTAATVVRALYK